MSSKIVWPSKKREFHNHHFDSTIWNDFQFRDDDIIIATYAKSGTTWVQQIVAQLIAGGDPDLAVAEMSPWLDLRVPPKEIKLPAVEAQTHRRFIKTHLSVDALVFSPKAKYLYVGRDGRDVVWSMYNHHANANQSGTTPSIKLRAGSGHRSNRRRETFGSIGATGWIGMVIRSGPTGKTFEVGGRSAFSPM